MCFKIDCTSYWGNYAGIAGHRLLELVVRVVYRLFMMLEIMSYD